MIAAPVTIRERKIEFPFTEMQGAGLKLIHFGDAENGNLSFRGYRYSLSPLDRQGNGIYTDNLSAEGLRDLDIGSWRVRMKPPNILIKEAPVRPLIIPEYITCEVVRTALSGYGELLGLPFRQQADLSWKEERAPSPLPLTAEPLMRPGMCGYFNLLDSDYLKTNTEFRKIPCGIKYDSDPFSRMAHTSNSIELRNLFKKWQSAGS
jgi:hypothetical protein